MQAYMKSAMPYRGVRVPEVRALTRRIAASHPFEDASVMRSTVLTLWREAEFREERYAACALTDTASARRLRSPDLVPMYREMIISGAWWDHVDEVSHRIRDLLLEWPDVITPIVRGWAIDDDRWLRRVAVICQVGAKGRTDRALLSDAVLANAADRDFFLRKAIGWALRDYARTDPAWVRDFVGEHEDALSPLSKREALKHLG